MKLHDPATERELLRLAAAGRNGKELESPDRRREWFGILMVPLIPIVFAYLPAGALGAFDTRLRTEHWQTLICCILLMWSAQTGLGSLIGSITGQGYHAVFVNLPIRGEHAMSWVRSRFLREKWFSVLALGFLCSLAVHDFSLHAPWNLAATTLLLFATTFATMMLLNESWFTRLKLARIWSLASLLLAGWMFLLYITNRRIFRIGGTPEWMADAILGFSWILPPSWCLPGRFENGGGLLAVIWIGWGFARWMDWPKLAAPFFDAPQDFVEAFGDFAFDEGDEDEDCPTEPEIEAVPVLARGENRKIVRLPAPLAMPDIGYVDRWVRRWIRSGDQNLAAAIVDPNPIWAMKTRWTLLVLPVWLAVILAFTKLFPESDWKETITIWLWIVSVVLPFAGLLPFSNAIPRAAATWSVGAQKFPFFSALPVRTSDLLRISTRITVARCILMGLLGTPFAWCLLAILDPASSPWAVVWLVPALCCFWITSRPLFLWYRLQSRSRRRRGAGVFVSHTLIQLLSLVLGIVWLLSGAAGVISGLGYFWSTPVGDDLWVLPMMAVGGLILSGICARTVFGIYLWQLSRRHFDWLSSE
jgi:hypothetical protein